MDRYNGLNPQTEWFTIDQAARMTKRNPSLIRLWVAQGRLPATEVTKGAGWPYPILLSPDACILLARDDTCAAATAAGNLIAPELRWSPADVAEQVRAFVAIADASRAAADLPPVHLAEATVPK